MKRIWLYYRVLTHEEVEQLLKDLEIYDTWLPIPRAVQLSMYNRTLDQLGMQVLFTHSGIVYAIGDNGNLRLFSKSQYTVQEYLDHGYAGNLYLGDKHIPKDSVRVDSVCNVHVDSTRFYLALNTIRDKLLGCSYEDYKHGINVIDMIRTEYNRRVINYYVTYRGDSQAFCRIEDWDDYSFQVYSKICAVLQERADNIRDKEWFGKYKILKKYKDIAQYITSIKQPKVDRYLGNTDTRTFDTVTVEITLVSSNKQERNSKLRENVGKLTTIVLDWVATSKRYTKYGIPVCYLKPAQFTITSDERLVMLFTLKDGLESIPDVV